MPPDERAPRAGMTVRLLDAADPRHSDRKAKRMVDSFSVTLTTEPDRAQLQLRGELDFGTVDEFAAKVDEACVARPSLLLVDLTELTFCDSSGIHVLIRTAAKCTCMNTEMQLVGTPPNVRRVFELTGTAELLHLRGDGDEAS